MAVVTVHCASSTARLTAKESRRFVQAILVPPEPNAALRSALKRYRSATKA